MALCQIHLGNQNALRKMVGATVLLPENAGLGPFPVCYLLHGLSDDHTAWTRRTHLERYVEGWPLIVVMPDGGRGFYTDSVTEPAGAFETFLVRDLIGFVDRTFQTQAMRARRVVAGLSMGGYGAIKLALKFPDLFCAASSHSGALWRPDQLRDYAGSELSRVFGVNPAGGPNDVYALASQIDRRRAPAFRLDCGTEDYLLPPNRLFHQHLEATGIPHQYHEYPGGHDWGYWDAHLPETLEFLGQALGLAGRSA